MRVVYLTHYAELYGANRGLLDMMDALRAGHGVLPHVLLPHAGPMVDELVRREIPFAIIPWEPWTSRPIYMGGPHHRLQQWWRHRQRRRARRAGNAAAIPGLSAICREWNVELIHVNSSVIGLGQALSCDLGVPWVWHVRELLGPHFGHVPDGGTKGFGQRLRSANAVIGVSQAVRHHLQAIAGKELPVHVVPNAVFTSEEQAAIALEAHDRWSRMQPFRFILTGVFHASKGQLEAVEAIAGLHGEGHDVHLTLAGGGDDAPVRNRIAELGIPHLVTITGYVQHPMPFYLDAHCALTCSRHEAFGRVTLEALSSGIPVIGHRSGGTPELISDGRNGFLYRSHAQLLDHMRTLVRDHALAQHMGTQALASAANGQTITDMAAQVARVYSAIGAPRPS